MKNDKVTAAERVKANKLMTGQEWYDRFVVEYLTILGTAARSLVDPSALNAAKRASGIEEQS